MVSIERWVCLCVRWRKEAAEKREGICRLFCLAATADEDTSSRDLSLCPQPSAPDTDDYCITRPIIFIIDWYVFFYHLDWYVFFNYYIACLMPWLIDHSYWLTDCGLKVSQLFNWCHCIELNQYVGRFYILQTEFFQRTFFYIFMVISKVLLLQFKRVV